MEDFRSRRIRREENTAGETQSEKDDRQLEQEEMSQQQKPPRDTAMDEYDSYEPWEQF